MYGCSTLYGLMRAHEGLRFPFDAAIPCSAPPARPTGGPTFPRLVSMPWPTAAWNSRAIAHILDCMAPSYKLGTGATVEPIRHSSPAARVPELVARAMVDRHRPQTSGRSASPTAAARGGGAAVLWARPAAVGSGAGGDRDGWKGRAQRLHHCPDRGGGGLAATSCRTPQPASTGGGRPPRVGRATRQSATWPSECEPLPPACGSCGTGARSSPPHPLRLAVSRQSLWGPTRGAAPVAQA